MAHIDGDSDIGRAVATALGIDITNVKGLSLRIYADEVVTVTIEKLVDHTELEKLVKVLGTHKFDMHKKG